MSQQLYDHTETIFPIKTDNPNFSRTILGGISLIKNARTWKALVVMEEKEKKYIRFYSWQMRKDLWKLQLCNLKIRGSFWDDLSLHIEELKELYEL
ncbi:MAG: hypothetical protein HeimC2_38150 [Candidatus Heimdallarchaeota archaeon LC_2]|nr:MAG: hypothetical protein HeimC2_38150 [Candidatus Heimdallarchaeota archaeon LC_2]